MDDKEKYLSIEKTIRSVLGLKDSQSITIFIHGCGLRNETGAEELTNCFGGKFKSFKPIYENGFEVCLFD